MKRNDVLRKMKVPEVRLIYILFSTHQLPIISNKKCICRKEKNPRRVEHAHVSRNDWKQKIVLTTLNKSDIIKVYVCNESCRLYASCANFFAQLYIAKRPQTERVSCEGWGPTEMRLRIDFSSCSNIRCSAAPLFHVSQLWACAQQKL